MRQLHPVSTHEKFVASGVYTHFRGERQVGIVESWSINDQPGNGQIVRVDYDGREHDGRSILIEAWLNSQKRTERFDIQAYGSERDSIKHAKARYLLMDGKVQITRAINGMIQPLEEMSADSSTIIYPGTALFEGFMVAQSAAHEQDIPVISYNPLYAYQAHQSVDVFRGYYQKYAAVRFLEKRIITITGKLFEARGYESPAAMRDQCTVAWLDEKGILLRLDNPGGLTILLTQYARRPELKKS
jgi:hypothetical protein